MELKDIEILDKSYFFIYVPFGLFREGMWRHEHNYTFLRSKNILDLVNIYGILYDTDIPFSIEYMSNKNEIMELVTFHNKSTSFGSDRFINILNTKFTTPVEQIKLMLSI